MATSEMPCTQTSEVIDSRLLHMWEAHSSLQKRWLKNKHNRALKLRISALTREMETHAAQLSHQQWGQVCDRLAGNLGLKDTWRLLRCLLEPDHAKNVQQKNVTRLIHGIDMDNDNIIQSLKDTYLTTTPKTPLPQYLGTQNHELDEDITKYEVRAAMLQLRTTSAPGADQVTNKTLRNLDENSIQAITELFNKHWQEGTLPSEWTHAQVTFIPKPGKPLTLSNLRPISLTSCLGKLFEHVVLNRLHTHMQTRDLFPHTMLGFRSHLCTQDVMLQISEEILHPRHCKRTRALLALDLQKAFDNVYHSSILDALSTLNVGNRTHAYISAFLRDRTAEIRFGPLKSPTFTLGNRGTPQISPFPFFI